MGYAAIFQTGLKFLPLAGGLAIPFLGGQKTDKQPLNLFPDNTGINFEASPSISNPFDFQKLLNLGKKDTFTEDFLQGKTTDKYPMSSEAVQGLKDQATLFNKDGDYVGGVLPSGIVESKPTTMLQEQNQILDAYGRPIVKSNTSSTTFDNTDISSNNNNNNNNNNKKDGSKFNKFLLGGLLVDSVFDLSGRLSNKIGDIFSKDDDKNEEDGFKTDFEKMTGITYEKAMELQRKRENELIDRRALEGGFKDAGKYMYLAGAAGMEAGKNIGRNTQDMLRSMAYGQSSLANTIAAAAKTTPLTRTYFS